MEAILTYIFRAWLAIFKHVSGIQFWNKLAGSLEGGRARSFCTKSGHSLRSHPKFSTNTPRWKTPTTSDQRDLYNQKQGLIAISLAQIFALHRGHATPVINLYHSVVPASSTATNQRNRRSSPTQNVIEVVEHLPPSLPPCKGRRGGVQVITPASSALEHHPLPHK